MRDDWREETQLRIQNSKIYQSLKLKCKSEAAGDHVLSLVDDAINYAYQRTKSILRHMNEFTLHDGEHLFRVLKIMEDILSEANINKLTTPELMLLILSAFFHDIGMAPSEKEVLAWKKVWDISPEFKSDIEKDAYNKFKQFCSSKPEQLNQIDILIAEGNSTLADCLKSYLISDFIRNTHAIRAKEIIQQDWNGKIKYRDTDLTVEFAEICFSHNEDALLILNLDKSYLCGPETYACLPLVAVVLRLADVLDFDAKRTPSILFSHLAVKHPISIKEWNKHRAIEAWTIKDTKICFHAKCTHPAIEASIHSFCDLIDNELSVCNNIISLINEHYKSSQIGISLRLPFKVNREKIETKKDIFGNPQYIYRKTEFNLSKRQVIDLLMGTKLYGDPEVAMRELLQNSIDACLLRGALEKKWGNHYSPEIHVNYYKENDDRILEIIDNGIGMDQEIIDNYYSKVGSSFYNSGEFYDLRSYTNADFVPTSRFGIGILSCFMVADTLIVDTRKIYGPHESSAPLNIVIEGQESIFWIKQGERKIPGTSTKLILRKKKNPWENMTEDKFVESVEAVIPNPPFKIFIKTNSQEKIRDEHSFREITASSLRDYSWNKNENVKEIEFNFNQEGLVGSAIVAILEKGKKPVMSIDMTSKEVYVEGEEYRLNKTIGLGGKYVKLTSKSLEVNESGKIKESESSRQLFNSRSRISLHGIEVPCNLFPDDWNMQRNQVKLDWPFPILLVVDVNGKRDLDLNSSRTQIIISDKWIKFEEDLSFVICSGISKLMNKCYWESFKTLLCDNTKNENFLNGLAKLAGKKRD
ncbi:ATP-binding protein|uniref:Histidine kinase-, DNA gyrase B-, and HSP90-like ATPase n=1 Tax=Dendrosporobacter quercicolus TaxID=146817 RepID=A0A1G9XDW8_9FIRM|nr:ATP-binding protein [Dendrosporobacter quercicolus]NSL49690.1 ATP-binding protein [Dendrosporobacter quercicolus DSM 1736]SDM94999.1 Histidine kinase-, DNA gyrase B-, and HSP90-like ATPase [Dendrosporobacter quercicolus]